MPRLAPDPQPLIPRDRPWTHVCASVVLAFAPALALAWWHAGVVSWIQSIYYVAAALPLAVGFIHLDRHVATADPRARRMFVYHFAMAIGIGLYAFVRVEDHQRDLEMTELRLAPMLHSIEDYRLKHGRYPAGLPPLAPSDGAAEIPADLHLDYTRNSDEAFTLSFRHSINRHHRFQSSTRQWDDVD